MNDIEQRKAAKEFAALWKGRGDEKQETQQFWSDLLHRVFGINLLISLAERHRLLL